MTIPDEEKGLARIEYDFDTEYIHHLNVHGPLVVKSGLTETEAIFVPSDLKDLSFLTMDWDEKDGTLDIWVDSDQMKRFGDSPVLCCMRYLEADKVLAEKGARILVNGDCKLKSVTLKGGSRLSVDHIFYSEKMDLLTEDSSASFHGLMADQLTVQTSGKSAIEFERLSARDCDFFVSDASRISANGMAFSASVHLYNQSVVDISNLVMNMITFTAFGQSTLKYHAEWEEKCVSQGCEYQNYNKHVNYLDCYRIEPQAYQELSLDDACMLMSHLLPPDAPGSSHIMRLALSYDKEKRFSRHPFFASKSLFGKTPILLIGESPGAMQSYDASQPFQLARYLRIELERKKEAGSGSLNRVLVSVSPGDLDGEAIPQLMQVLESTPEEMFEEIRKD